MITNEAANESGCYQEDGNSQGYIVTQNHLQNLHLSNTVLMTKIW